MNDALPTLRPSWSEGVAAARLSARKRLAVERAKQALFFRRRLDHVDLDRLDDPAEWAKLPILDKDQLRALSDDDFYRAFCLPPADGDTIAQYWRSGGATGRPLFYPRSRRDVEAALVGFARVFPCAGAELAAKAHCSFPLGIHPAGQMMARAAEELGMGVVLAGAGTTTPSALQLDLVERLRPRVWMGMPSYGLHLANLADQHGTSLVESAVDLVLTSAEPLSAAKREKLQRQWGAAVRDTFGMTEAGMMGAEDAGQDGFRLWTDLFHIEVLDPQTLVPVADGEIGTLVVTPLYTNNVTPFLRWKSGDLVTLRRDASDGPFGRFPLVKHAHRTEGFFKIKGININHSDFEDFMFRDVAVSDFKGEALTVGDDDVFRVSVEVGRGVEAAPALDALRTRIKQVFELGAEVVLLEPGTLAREFEASIKAPRMVDRRR